jgi:hypothetical protein
VSGYRTLALLITTVCNRSCPRCCYRIPQRQFGVPRHYDWAYFERAAQFLHGVDTLNVAGGEPTLHPEFDRVAHEFKAMFKPRALVLVTNGVWADVEATGRLMDCFDQVWVSRERHEAERPGGAWMRTHLPAKYSPLVDVHRSMSIPGGGGPCDRYWMAAYAAGRLYPCCVGPGLADAATVAPSPAWREELSRLARPCATCAFSQPDRAGVAV